MRKVIIIALLLAATLAAGLYANKSSQTVPLKTANSELSVPTDLPTATPTDLPIPMPSVSTPSLQTNNSDPLIDCIGPDGKHLEVTQQECDSFNAAWGKVSLSPSPPPTPLLNNSSQTNSYGSSFADCMKSYNEKEQNDPKTAQANADRAIVNNPQATQDEKNRAVADLSGLNYYLGSVYNLNSEISICGTVSNSQN